MPNLIVPKEFFRKERNDIYASWSVAFWRELFQNSTDAGARAISVIFVPFPGVTRVVFIDDGCGMDRHTLTNIYFRLGATTKTDDDSIGGFGRARILTCFSMRRYTIRTGTLLVEGDGAYYDITEGYPHVDGVVLEIDIDHRIDTDESTLRQALADYLAHSQIKARVVVDGVSFANWLQRGRKIREVAHIDEKPAVIAYVDRNGPHPSTIIVRVDGTYMYKRRIRAAAQVILEIDRKNSRNILTASRDNLRYAFAEAVETFIDELAANVISAIKPRKNRHTATYRGYGMIVTEHAPRSEGPTFPAAASALPPIGLDALPGATSAPQPPATDWALARPDIRIFDETDNSTVRRVIHAYNPDTWDMDAILNHAGGQGYKLYRLLMTWKAACSIAVRAFVDVRQVNRVIWTVGWYFGDPDKRAVCEPIGDGFAFCLNPVDLSGKLAWKTASRVDRKRLLAVAKHEAAHIEHSWHNEAFSSLVTSIDAVIDDQRAASQLRAAI